MLAESLVNAPCVWRIIAPCTYYLTCVCWDNAVAESFFATLKTEAFGDHIPDEPDEATRIVGEYVDGYYNPKRRHSYNDHQSPIGSS